MDIINWQAVNSAAIVILVAIVAYLSFQAGQLIKQRLSAEDLKTIRALVRQAVIAAEQYGGENNEKKEIALEFAQKWLHERGIFLDLHDLDAAIEAAVYSEIHHFVYDMELSPGAAAVRPEAAE